MIRNALMLILLSVAFSAHAEINRHALVIGNSNYDQGALKNPRNDANDIARALRDLGFTIHKNAALLDLDHTEFQGELESYRAALPQSAISIVYYAGHGLSWRADNYLIPVDAEIQQVERLHTEAISLQGLVNRLNSRNTSGVNIFLLDACRDNPLNKQLGSEREGLVRLKALPHSTFIGYAAQEGKVVSDGEVRNGLYTQELIKALRNDSHKSIEALHDIVEFNVYDQSRRAGFSQIPMAHETVTDSYCFGQCSDAGNVIQDSDSAVMVQSGEPLKKKNSLYIVLGAVAVAVLAVLAGSRDGEPTDSVLLTLNPPAP